MSAGPLPPPPAPSLFGPITLTDVVRYQGASGDMNPSHHDDAFARRNGFGAVFVPGLFSAGLLGDWATAWLGPANLRRIAFRFRMQVWLGDVLESAGAIAGASADRVELELVCRRGNDLVTTASATFVRTSTHRRIVDAPETSAYAL